MGFNSVEAAGGIARLAALLLLLLSLGACSSTAEDGVPDNDPGRPGEFRDPKPVSILGYKGDAMEPFVTRDGEYLFFNNLNDPSVDTKLHYAKRIDDATFEYMGEMGGVNTKKLEGVPTMDVGGDLYFVSTRSYDETFSTIYRGRFEGGLVTDIEIVEGIPPKKPLFVNFDVEVSADGSTLYFVVGKFGFFRRVPKSSDIHVAVKTDGGFRLHGRDGEIMKNINTDALEYAAAISADGHELFFTRLEKVPLFSPPNIGIYIARRGGEGGPFGRPKKIDAITGFAEAPCPSPDGRTLYYHRKTADGFAIYCVSR